MLHNESANRDSLNILQCKLQKDYDKLLKKLPKKELTEKQEKMLDSITMGNDVNDRVIMGSLAVPFAPMAVGIGKATIGLISLIPSLATPPNEESVAFFAQAKEFSENNLSSGMGNVFQGVPLLVVPATVAALSLSVRIYRNLKDKKINEAKYTGATIKLIDDILANKEDPTLDFAYKFVRRVDLSENDPKVNLNILKQLTYYRYILQQQRFGKISGDEVEDAFDNMVQYFKALKETNGVSDKFKHNRFINSMIVDYDEKIEKEMLSEAKSR